MLGENYIESSRKEYLLSLAEDLGISRKTVFLMAALLGESEDYDGLPSMVEELAEMNAETEEN